MLHEPPPELMPVYLVSLNKCVECVPWNQDTGAQEHRKQSAHSKQMFWTDTAQDKVSERELAHIDTQSQRRKAKGVSANIHSE